MEQALFSWHTARESLSDLQHGIELAHQSGASALLILSCEENQYPADGLSALLKSCPLTIFGGIYPMITFKQELLKQGAIIIGFANDFHLTLFKSIQALTDEEKLEQTITSTLDSHLAFAEQDNFLMFYDGLINNVENFVDCFFECLDHRINIAGGGAGYLDFIQRPCVFTNQGVFADAILLVSLPKKIQIGVGHGWKIFKGPFLVSEAEGQTVQSLNYQPAYELYKTTIEEQSSYTFTGHDFFDVAKNFPLGIEDINSNLIVRDPIVTQNNHLHCVGNVPINSMVYLLEGATETLVESAEQAAISAFSQQGEELTNPVALVFDCISRVLYMEEEFEKELAAIESHCPTESLFGVLSLGEIVNSQNGSIRLLNKSIVVSYW